MEFLEVPLFFFAIFMSVRFFKKLTSSNLPKIHEFLEVPI